MLHHACSLFITTTIHCLAVPSPLTGTLPDAAYRVWYRCASSTTRGPAHVSSIHCQVIRARSRTKPPTVGVSSINPNSLLEYDMKWEDPGRSYISYEHHFSSCLPLTWVQPATPKTVPQRFLFAQTSPLSFYQNLLEIASCQQSPLSAAIKYHSFPPCSSSALRSTRSYNLLIRLALRHASLGTAWQLFSTMRAEGIQGNLETWKLSVRWLVRTGQWEEAWHRVKRIVASQTWAVSSCKDYSQHILLPIWLEFFGTPKRGSTRQWIKKPERLAGHTNVPSGSAFPVLRDCVNTISLESDFAHYRMLVGHLPAAQLRARAVYSVVSAMLRSGRRRDALNITETYLQSLPRPLIGVGHRVALNIVHLHVIVGPPISNLEGHFALRGVINSLLLTHGILPTSMTVFLLLRSLRCTKKCGTFAKAFLDSWKKRWGAKMESSMVRRRVSILALKEGRIDIAGEMMTSEKQRKHLENLWYTRREVVGGGLAQIRPPRRLRLRKYAHKGTENRRWTKLKQKIDRVTGEEKAAVKERAGDLTFPIQSDEGQNI